MLFADFVEFFGQGVLWGLVILSGIWWLLEKAGKSASKVVKDKDFQEGVKIGLQEWLSQQK